MFDFGFSEMLVVGIVALVVLGPERLPVVARTAGEWIGKAQRFVAQVKSDIDRETELSELKKIQEEAQAIANDVKTEVESAATDIEKNMKETAKAVEAAGESIESTVEDAVADKTADAAAAQTADAAAKPVIQKVRTTTPEDLAEVYGWGYHSGPSVDELAQEIERLRRELGMRETNMGGTVGRRRGLAPRARSNRTRIYR